MCEMKGLYLKVNYWCVLRVCSLFRQMYSNAAQILNWKDTCLGQALNFKDICLGQAYNFADLYLFKPDCGLSVSRPDFVLKMFIFRPDLGL